MTPPPPFRRFPTTAARRLPPALALSLAAALLAVARPTARAADGELGIDRSGSAVRLTLKGENGREYSLEALQDLLNRGSVWAPVATVAPADRPVTLYDPTCSVLPQNFYRLRLLARSAPVEVPNFRLLDLDGRAHELFYQSDARAVVLVLAGTDPGAALAPEAAALRDLQALPAEPKVRTWIVTLGSPADRAARRAATAGLGLTLPVLEDEAGVVTRQIGAGIVPEALVLDPANWSILYRGRIADTLPATAGEPRQPLLLDALRQHLEGRPVVIRHTAPSGHLLAGPTGPEPAYATDIAPLFQAHCVRCHSPGNIAPWAMTNHAVLRDYAPLIKDEILTRRMPPWHADRGPRAYSNDASLPADALARLVAWIDRGAPRGDGPDPLAEAVPPPPPEWPMGTPDRVLSVAPQSIPASGTVDYRYLVLPNPYPNDVWLRAAVVKPGNPRVVHHVLVFSATSFLDVLQIQGGLGGYFAAYVPGMEQNAFPDGSGKLLPKGAFLVFQMHYTATGKPETDRTQLGLYLAPAPPARQLRTGAAYNTLFAIPPGSSDHVATAEFELPRDGIVYELSPHMHYRGNWFRFDAVLPDQRRETLLHVPYYRFDWQSLYRLAEPRRLPAGTRIVVSGGWDNSARNPYNPDPSATVRFGEQSWEEMLIGYFNWAEAP